MYVLVLGVEGVLLSLSNGGYNKSFSVSRQDIVSKHIAGQNMSNARKRMQWNEINFSIELMRGKRNIFTNILKNQHF